MHTRWLAPLVLVLTILTLSHCTPTEKTFKNVPVIFIVIDTLRSDHLPVYGYDKVKTPAFDAFAKDSLLFEHAYSQIPLTLPSHASMFTGNLPPTHGVRDNTGYALKPEAETLAERLRAEGYATGGVISGMVLRQSTGISQGFDFYEDQLNTQSKDQIRRYAARRGDKSLRHAQQWLNQQQPGSPFFLFLHLYDPHTPYSPPAPFSQQYAANPYDGEIAYVDSLLAELFADLKAKGIYEKALIVLTSDHGEGLGEHGEDEHGIFTYRESIQVPLIVKFPDNVRAGERQSAPVGLMDLKPSILQTLGLELAHYDGKPIFGSKIPSRKRPIYSETYSPLYSFGWCASRSVVVDNLQYIKICDPELYDLATDPGGLKNLVGKTKVPATALKKIEALGDGAQSTAENSAQDLELLASLGYAGGAVGIASDQILDPRKEIGVFRKLDDVTLMLENGQYQAAEATLTPILERNPALSDGRYMLIKALTEQGKIEEAEYVTLEGLGLFPNHLNFLLALSVQKLRRNLVDEAVKAAEKAFEIDPDTSGARLLLPLYEAGAEQMAVAKANQLLSEYSDSSLSAPYAYFIAGRDARQKGDLVQAITYLQRGLELKDRVIKPETLGYAYQALGDSLARLDRLEEALDYLQKAVALIPHSTNAQVALSYVYASMNRPREAIGVMDNWVRAFPKAANFNRAAQAMETMGLKTKARAFREAASRAQE